MSCESFQESERVLPCKDVRHVVSLWMLTRSREYLDVFDLFNFPRVPMTQDGVENGSVQAMGQAAAPDLASMNAAAMIPNFAVPNPEADWLFHTN